MLRHSIRPFAFVLLLAALAALPAGRRPQLRGEPAANGPRPETTVYLAGDLNDEQRIILTTTLEAARYPGVILFDTPKARPHLAEFLRRFGATAVVPVGTFADADKLAERLNVTPASALPFENGRPERLWRSFFPEAPRVVVCPSKARPLLLHAAALATTIHAPLFAFDSTDSAAALNDWVREWRTQEVILVGPIDTYLHIPVRSSFTLELRMSVRGPDGRLIAERPGPRIQCLPDEAAVWKACLSELNANGPIRNLVVTNPTSQWAALAPWIAGQKKAPLLLTDKDGRNVVGIVESAVSRPELRGADHVVLLGDRDALPTHTRANPIAGKDTEIEMEPLTPDSGLFRFAVGRLFGADPGIVALQLARQRLLQRDRPRQAVLVANPGGGLPLLETVSRHTAEELRFGGYVTHALFGKDVTADEVRRRLPGADLFIWEGHQATLFKEFGFNDWTEPLAPSLVILQSCLALTDERSLPLIERGALGVVGSSTRTYSASGGAFALAYLDAMLYDRQTCGGALRQAKNFLVLYQMLKEKRLKQVRLNGANQRSSWAFTLWGDPTLTLPLPPRADDRQAAVQHRLEGGDIVIDVPATAFARVSSGKFDATMRPNTRLAGLLRAGEGEGADAHLVPFLFAEVELPAANGRTPRLESKLPAGNWVFAWDARRHTGYLLILPRARDTGALRFAVAWDAN